MAAELNDSNWNQYARKYFVVLQREKKFVEWENQEGRHYFKQILFATESDRVQII